ncbi:MAG: flavin reductase family protein [Pseudomonadota bacterium]
MAHRSLGPLPMVFPHPVFVIGTYGPDGVANLATASWAGICCSRPPSVAVSFRAATLTHGNIARRGAFTVNIPGTAQVAEADGAGVLSGHQGDKPAALGLAVARAALVDAPYVPAFPVVLACRLNHTHELGLHTQYVGEILDVLVAEEALDERGVPDIRRIDPLVYAGGARAYFSVGRFVAQAFAKRGG